MLPFRFSRGARRCKLDYCICMAAKNQPKPQLSRSEKILGQCFASGGYLRIPDADRLGDTSYKKGWEVRLT